MQFQPGVSLSQDVERQLECNRGACQEAKKRLRGDVRPRGEMPQIANIERRAFRCQKVKGFPRHGYSLQRKNHEGKNTAKME